MPRPAKATRENVFAAADELVAAGTTPTTPLIVERVGGSNSTVGPLLREWRAERAQAAKQAEQTQAQNEAQPEPPAALIALPEVEQQMAGLSQAILATVTRLVEAERDKAAAAIQAERDRADRQVQAAKEESERQAQAARDAADKLVQAEQAEAAALETAADKAAEDLEQAQAEIARLNGVIEGKDLEISAHLNRVDELERIQEQNQTKIETLNQQVVDAVRDKATAEKAVAVLVTERDDARRDVADLRDRLERLAAAAKPQRVPRPERKANEAASPARKVGGKREPITAEQRARILAMHAEGGRSQRDVAREVGVSHATVVKILNQAQAGAAEG